MRGSGKPGSNFLAQVNKAHWVPAEGGAGGGASPLTGGGTGEPNLPEGQVVIDELVKHYTYDGLGRLVRTQSPYPNPELGISTGLLRSERFYYDGIRRIQEVVTDPIASLGEVEEGLGAGALSGPVGGGSGNPVAPEDPESDPDAAPVTLEQAQLLAGAGGAGGALNQLPQTVSTLAREYVWGPGDWHPGVDELLVQYAGSSNEQRAKPWWVVQDAGGDVVSLCENALPAQAGGTPGPTTVAAQWTYDAFGSALTAEHLAAHPFVHLGHKGLFFDRLDVGVVSTLGTELPRLAPYAHLVVQMRNRAYLPSLGRFLQRDPNATGMALIEAPTKHGGRIGAQVETFSLEEQLGDGANLLAYLGGNAWTRRDPLGLFFSGIGPTDTLMLGFELGRVAFNLIDQYAGDMEAGAAWAEDWSLDDNLFSEESARAGARQEAAESLDLLSEAGGGGELTYARAREITTAIKAAQLAGRVRSGAMYPTYYAARYAIRQAGAKLQAHHIVEVRVLRAMGMDLNGPAIALTRAQHLVVTNRLRTAIPYGTKLGPENKAMIIARYRDAYKGLPDLLTKALEILD